MMTKRRLFVGAALAAALVVGGGGITGVADAHESDVMHSGSTTTASHHTTKHVVDSHGHHKDSLDRQHVIDSHGHHKDNLHH